MNKIILIIGLLSLLLLTSCKQTITENYCQGVEDCVPATCCHPTEAVNINYAPDCEDVMCTMDCRPETLDCGQGYIDCVNNVCEVIIE
jgi:hypothetical protein